MFVRSIGDYIPSHWGDKTFYVKGSYVERVELESEAIDLYADYEKWGLPTMVMAPQMSKGLLREQDLVLFSRQSNTKIVHFEKSDHMIRHCKPEKFMEEIVGFAKELS